jgi:hypothetical protein
MSKKSAHRGTLTQIKDRPGEFTVPVSKQTIPAPDGSSQVSVSIRLEDVPIPDRRYTADVGTVLFDGSIVRVVFGQKRLVGDDLRSLVIVSVSPDRLRRFLDSCTTFLPELDAFIEKNCVAKPELLELNREPEQTVAVASNIITAARAGREASIDFYHTSAAAVHAMSSRDRLAIDPILRVDLSTGLLAVMLGRLNGLKDKLPEEAK